MENRLSPGRARNENLSVASAGRTGYTRTQPIRVMKPSPLLLLLLATGVPVLAQTEEHLNQRFNAQPGGKLVVEADAGSIEVTTNDTGEATVDVFRRLQG